MSGSGEFRAVIEILFFAKLREVLGTGSVQLDFAGDIASLKSRLAQRGEPWSEQMGQKNLLCAINQQLASDESLVSAGDEVAFFPPVTGG